MEAPRPLPPLDDCEWIMAILRDGRSGGGSSGGRSLKKYVGESLQGSQNYKDFFRSATLSETSNIKANFRYTDM